LHDAAFANQEDRQKRKRAKPLLDKLVGFGDIAAEKTKICTKMCAFSSILDASGSQSWKDQYTAVKSCGRIPRRTGVYASYGFSSIYTSAIGLLVHSVMDYHVMTSSLRHKKNDQQSSVVITRPNRKLIPIRSNYGLLCGQQQAAAARCASKNHRHHHA